MPEMIRCDCWGCIYRPLDDPSVLVTTEFYWNQRRTRPHYYDGRARSLTREQLQPGDVFRYSDGLGETFFVSFAGDEARFGDLLRSRPNHAGLNKPVTVIGPADPRCSVLHNNPYWPHYGLSEVVSARRGILIPATPRFAPLPDVPTIDPNTAEVW